MENYIYDAFKQLKEEKTLEEDTVKQGSKWVNKGKEGTHGTFKTKKAADAQRRAMFANKGKKATFGESIEKFPIGSTFTNAGYTWEVLDRKGEDSLLFSPTRKFMPYAVVWRLEDDGSWGQGHYFQNKDDAVRYFEDQKIYEALDYDKQKMAEKVLRLYYNQKIDMPELHKRLYKLFDNHKDAVEWLYDNDELVRHSALKESKRKKLKEDFDDSITIHDWYVKEFPDDELGEEINKKLTFDILYDYLKKKKFNYGWVANDSIVRERVFSELARRKDVDYDHIYYLWVDSDDTLEEKKSRKKNLKEAKDDEYFMKAFVTNLGKYNEGELIGEWVEFPIDEDDFNKVLEKIGISDKEDKDGVIYEEWFVTDYDCNLPGFDWKDLGEYPSYEQLNEFGELVERANDYSDPDAVADAYEVLGDLEQAIDGLDNGDIIFYSGIDTQEELGERIIDEEFAGEISDELLERYFDFDALGRDIRLEYSQQEEDDPETAGEYWCGDETATDEEIGEEVVDQLGFDVVSNKEYYFDYDAFGRDLTYDNFTLTTHGAIEQL